MVIICIFTFLCVDCLCFSDYLYDCKFVSYLVSLSLGTSMFVCPCVSVRLLLSLFVMSACGSVHRCLSCLFIHISVCLSLQSIHLYLCLSTFLPVSLSEAAKRLTGYPFTYVFICRKITILIVLRTDTIYSTTGSDKQRTSIVGNARINKNIL